MMLVPATSFAQKRQAELAAGEIFVSTIPMPGAYYPKVHVEGVVDAPPAKVFAIVKDCARSQHVNANVMKSYVVKRIKDDVVCSELIDLPWPIRNLESITRWSFAPGPAIWTKSWTLAGGEDFDYANGSWRMERFGDGSRTLVVYENHFSPRISVPDWLTRAFLKVGLPGLIKDLRKAAATP